MDDLTAPPGRTRNDAGSALILTLMAMAIVMGLSTTVAEATSSGRRRRPAMRG